MEVGEADSLAKMLFLSQTRQSGRLRYLFGECHIVRLRPFPSVDPA